MHTLIYDRTKWLEVVKKPENALQIFITNRCNLRCHDCFYIHKLGKNEMSFREYQEQVCRYLPQIKEVTLIGGEPTLHKDLPMMIAFNNFLALGTLIYSNGHNLEVLEGCDLSNTSIRIDGKSHLAPLAFTMSQTVRERSMIVFMLRKNNLQFLSEAASIAEQCGFKKFFVSSIRDIHRTGSYWRDTEDTLSMPEYAEVVQKFVDDYDGNMEIHISRRGILTTEACGEFEVEHCRFGNLFPDGSKIICPFDISKNLTTDELTFGERKCNKHTECLLRKIVLKRK